MVDIYAISRMEYLLYVAPHYIFLTKLYKIQICNTGNVAHKTASHRMFICI